MKSVGRSLKSYLVLTWVMPAVVAMVGSLTALLVFGWLDYQTSVSQITSDLTEKSRAAARRLSAEILIGPNGSTDTVALNLKKEMGLNSVSVSRRRPLCIDHEEKQESCSHVDYNLVRAFHRIPFVQDPIFAEATAVKPSFFASLKLSLVFWSAFPIFIVAIIGIWWQRRLLKKYVESPIHSLIETASKGDEFPDWWPKEFHELSERLEKSYQQRDQALIGQFTSGIIHDIKTLLHSPLSALSLVKEQSQESPKRITRLESLARTCDLNLPKINALVELTLDGNRDISLALTESDLRRTIAESIETNRDLAKSRGVQILTEGLDSELSVVHDPVQLERAFTNLIRNGIEAFDQSSESARSKVLRVKANLTDQQVSLSVEDSGPGLPETPARILKSVRSSKLHGTGLGLLVTRKIVEAHKGTLEASTSRELKGASFRISLPFPIAAGEVRE